MTVAELIALLQERPQDQTVLVAFTPQDCQDAVDSMGSEPCVGYDTARFLTPTCAEFWAGAESHHPEVTVIYALDS